MGRGLAPYLLVSRFSTGVGGRGGLGRTLPIERLEPGEIEVVQVLIQKGLGRFVRCEVKEGVSGHGAQPFSFLCAKWNAIPSRKQ